MPHSEILTKEQKELLPLIKKFSKDFYMVGGTAISYHIGHRRSIDFDLFTRKKFDNKKIKDFLHKQKRFPSPIWDKLDQYTIKVNNVKMTFFWFDYDVVAKEDFEGTINIPDLITLAAMKAFAMGDRAKWKDYVDLYFIFRDYYGIGEVIKKTKELFKDEFNPKLFRLQISNFDYIDYREPVEYLSGFDVSEEEIKKKLIKYSLSDIEIPVKKKTNHSSPRL